MAIRVLFVTHTLPPVDTALWNGGGQQRVAGELYTALAAHPDIELQALVLRCATPWYGIRSVAFVCSLLWRLPREVARRPVDLVLFSCMTTAIPILVIASRVRSQGAKITAIAHGLDVVNRAVGNQAIIKKVLVSLDAVLAVSRATRAACVARGVEESKVFVVPNGFDLARFKSVSAGDPKALAEPIIAGETPLPEDVDLLISVGRQVRRKGFAWFVEQVMPQLPDNVHYWLAGDGPERTNIAKAAARARVTDRVRLLGAVSDEQLLKLYRRGQLFIMPNVPVAHDMEGFGVVMLEAGACGLPAVAADIEGIRDVIREGANGYLCASGDPRAFSRRILELLHDRDRLAHLSQCAVETVTRTYQWPVVVERYVDVLEKLSAQKESVSPSSTDC